MSTILINKQTRIPYEHIGGNTFRNVHTGKEGEVPEDKAKDVFVLNVDVAQICLENPNVVTLMQKFNLLVR